MKLRFLIISLVVLFLGCTKNPYRQQRNMVAHDLGIKKSSVEIAKIDPLFLQTQVPFIKSRLKKISEILKKFNIEDTITIFNYYRFIDFPNDELSAYSDTLWKFRLADSCGTADKRIVTKREKLYSLYNKYSRTVDTIRKYSKTIGVDFFPENQDDFKRENLFFIKDLANNKSYVFDFDKKGNSIERKIKLSEQIP